MIRFPALLGLLAVAPCVAAQHLPVRSLGAEAGVGTVYALAPSADGLWLATSGGLRRYDGARVLAEPLPAAAPHGVVALDGSPDGHVWAWAPPHLIHRAPAGAARRVPLPARLRAALGAGHAEDVVVRALGDGGVAIVKPGAGLWLRTAAGRWRHLTALGVKDVAADGATLWVLTRDDRAMGRLGRVDLRRPGAPAWLPDPVVAGRHVRPHPDGAWLATGRGLYLVRRDGRRTTVLGDSARCWFTTPDTDASGALALTVETSVLAFYVVEATGRVRLRLTGGHGLRTMSTKAARFDGEGGLFVASHLGLDYVEDPERVQLVPISPVHGVSDLGVSPADGALWLTSYGGGVFRHDGRALRTLRPNDSSARGAGSLRLFADGAAVWTEWQRGRATVGWRWDGTAARPLGTRPFPIFAEAPTLVAPADDVRIVRRADGRVLTRDGPVHHPIAAWPPGRRRWFRLGAHLESLDGDTLASASPAAPPSVRAILRRYRDRVVTGIDTDAAGRVWVATTDGLLMLRGRAGGAWEATERRDAPAGVEHLDLHRDHLWLATLDGVRGYRLVGDTPELVPLALPGLDRALPARAIYRVAETLGALWVLTQGPPTLVRYRPGRVLGVPAVRLSEARVNGWRLGGTSAAAPLVMRSDTSRVALAFAPASFRRATDLRLDYRVDGGAWVRFAGEPTLRLEALAPGRHTVEARAWRTGQPHGPVLAVALDVRPPFYRATWFLALVGLGLLGLLVGGAQRRLRQSEARARALQATVAERTDALAGSLATVEAQAAQLREMDAARSRFFQNVSHELRTPLTLLLGPLADAAAGRASPDTLLAQLPSMERNARRLRRLVDALLDLARLDAGHLRLYARPTDLVAHVRTAVASFASGARRQGVDLSFHAGPDALRVWVDRDRVEEVVVNLVGNALKFTPAGGTVRVTVDADRAAGDAVLTVADTGRGIAADLLPHVFERFRQAERDAERPAEGVGIGLALVREVVARHGGAVGVESPVGEAPGSRFTVRLPLDAARLPPEMVRLGDESPAPTVPAASANATSDLDAPPATVAPADAPAVLVVEDNADLRDYLRGLLAPTYRVDEAADGRAGLDAARAAPPDLVVSDVMMPEMDGVALCRALKADPATAHVPVVLLTARTDEASRLEGLAGGADDYLGKPFSAAELLARCENLVELRRRLRDRLAARGAEAPEAPPESAWAAAARGVVEANLDNLQFGVDWMADALATSARTLHRQCRAETDLTPAAFIRSVRLERAADLLAEGGRTVGEVAAAVGYADAGHFARRFRQAFGVLPSGYPTDAG